MSKNEEVLTLQGGRTRNRATTDSLNEPLSNPEAVLHAQRDARTELLPAGTRERRFAELNEAAPIPDVPPEEDLTPTEVALLGTNYPLHVPVSLGPVYALPEPTLVADSAPEPPTAARNEDTSNEEARNKVPEEPMTDRSQRNR